MKTKMPALSLWQPWASLIACGAKRIETRSWKTGYRGNIAIHAARKWDRNLRALAAAPDFRAHLQPLWPSSDKPPLGVILCIARLVDCVPTEELLPRISDQEKRFGNYAPGRYGWLLEDILSLPEPIPARGAQGLWQWQYQKTREAK